MLILRLLLVALPLVALALWRPAIAVAASIPLPVISFYGYSNWAYPLIAMVACVAVIVALVRAPRGERGVPWRRVAPILALPVVILGQYALPSSLHTPTTLGFVAGMGSALLAGAAAVVVGPPPRSVLIAVAATGTGYAALAMSEPLLATIRETAVAGQNANGLGFLAATGLVAALTLAVLDRSRWIAVVALAAAVACALGLLATSSISSGLTAAAGAVAVIIVGLLGSREQRWRTAGLVVLVALPAALLAAPLWERFGGEARSVAGLETSWQIRGSGTAAALRLFLSAPFPGAGIGQSAQAGFERGLTTQPTAPHNAYVGLASDLGVLVLLLFLALVALLVWSLRHRRNRLLVPLAVVYLLGGLGIEWPINPALGIGFWVLCGAALASGVPPEPAHAADDTPSKPADTASSDAPDPADAASAEPTGPEAITPAAGTTPPLPAGPG